MEKIAYQLRKKYILALSLIACLVILANFGTHNFLDSQIHDSRIINLAGKQRMLSQKITKLIYQLPYSQTDTEKTKMLTTLSEAVDLWEKTHKGLQLGDASLKLPGNNPPGIQALFDDIQDEHLAMLKAAKEILLLTTTQKNSEASVAPIREVLRQKEPIFLAGMDEIVFLYDDLARIKVENILTLEKALLVLTLLALVLEAIFIFRPAEQLVNRSIKGLLTNEKNLQGLFDTAPTANLLISIKDYKLIRVNTIASKLLVVDLDDHKDHFLYDFVESKYIEPFEAFIKDTTNTQMDALEVVVRNSNNDSTPILLLASKLFYENKDVLLVNFSDISAQKKSEALLNTLASIDEMTSMLNRRTGLVLFEKTLESAKRKRHALTVCFMDLDGLKHVNDTYGHLAGDTFIKTFARAIMKNVRAEDIAFRYGGDEFVVIFTESDPANVEQILNRIQADCQSFKNLLELPYDIGFSSGNASWDNGPNLTTSELIEIADEKMYKEKLRKYPDRVRG